MRLKCFDHGFILGGTLLLLGLAACSSPNTLAPAPGRAHPADYLLRHSADANADLAHCQTCHQNDLAVPS